MSGIPNVAHADPCTCATCNAKANRIAAFGAIRRAVDLARAHDKHAKRYSPGTTMQQASDRYAAREIRRAIRAAIGSPKA